MLRKYRQKKVITTESGVVDETPRTKIFVGIVGNSGVESFVEITKTDFPFDKRATASGRRDAIAFEVSLTKEKEQEIKDFINQGEFITAGNLIKRSS